MQKKKSQNENYFYYDVNNFGSFQLSHIQESEAGVGDLLDACAGAWDMDIASQLFALAEVSTESKKKRPTMVQVLHDYSNILNKW